MAALPAYKQWKQRWKRWKQFPSVRKTRSKIDILALWLYCDAVIVIPPIFDHRQNDFFHQKSPLSGAEGPDFHPNDRDPDSWTRMTFDDIYVTYMLGSMALL